VSGTAGSSAARGTVHGEWTIRAAGPGDAGWLAGFAARQFDAAYAEDNAPADMADYCALNFTEPRFAALLADPATRTLVAESRGEPIAYAVVRRSASPPEGVGEVPATELARLYLDAAWHGSGLASAMLAEAERSAIEWRASTVWLTVWSRNPRAIRFYRKHGYDIVGSMQFRLGAELQEDHLMIRTPAPQDSPGA